MVLDPDLADLWALILDFTARVIDVLGGVKFEYSVGWCAAQSRSWPFWASEKLLTLLFYGIRSRIWDSTV